MSVNYHGIIVLYIWDLKKTKYITLTKEIDFPFQPQVNQLISFGILEFKVTNLNWQLVDEVWEFRIETSLIEAELIDCELDIDYFVKQSTRIGFEKRLDFVEAEIDWIDYCFPEPEESTKISLSESLINQRNIINRLNICVGILSLLCVLLFVK